MVLNLYAALAALLAVSNAAPTTTLTTRTPLALRDVSTSSADITSMASVAAAAAATTFAVANKPAVPVPDDNSTAAQLLKQFPPDLPLMQISNAGPSAEDVNAMLSAIMAPPNASSTSGNTRRSAGQRVMVVGDSMTQGADGDWGWRYRMWQWARDNGLNWQFVGPYTGTTNKPVPGPPVPPSVYTEAAGTDNKYGPVANSGGYAADCDSAFLQDGGHNHFAVWGRAVAFDISTPPSANTPLLQGMVQQYQPDIMLIMLGFNDVGWFYSDGAGLLVNMGTLVAQARAANPNIAIAIANVVERKWIGGRQDLVDNTNYYDAHIGDAINQWTTDQSPIRLVSLREIYSCNVYDCPAGYDGLHPSALGDFEIARAFSLALSNDPVAFGLTSYVPPLEIPNPVPLRPIPMPTGLQVVTSPQGVTATWTPVPGAYGYNLQISIDGGSTWIGGSTTAARWDTQWPFDGYTYTIKVQAQAGEFDYLKSPWTDAQSAVSQSQLAPAPNNIRSQTYGNTIRVDWDPPTGPNVGQIVIYNIIIWDQDTECAFFGGGGFTSSPAIFTKNIIAGHRYVVGALTWNQNGGGLPSGANSVIVGAGTPATPTVPNLQEINAGALHMTWQGDSANAAGYTIYSRNINNSSDFSKPGWGSPSMPCWDVYYLFPGFWNYEFCVQAFNGNNLSPVGACTVLPYPTASVAPATACPPPKPWCPSFYLPANPPSGEDSAGGANGAGVASPTVAPSSASPTPTTAPTTTTTGAILPNSVVKHANGRTTVPAWATGTYTAVKCGQQPTNLPNSDALLGDVGENYQIALSLWQQSGATAALADAISAWYNRNSAATTFDGWLAVQFGLDTPQCDDILNGECFSNLPLCDHIGASPAFTYIFTAIHNLYNLYKTGHSAFDVAALSSPAVVNKWSQTFVQLQNKEDTKILETLIDVVTAFAGVGVGALFSPLEETIGSFAEGLLEEGINTAIDQGASAVKDGITNESDLNSVQLDLYGWLGNVYNQTYYAQEALLGMYFDGNHLDMLSNTISEGKLLYPSSTKNLAPIAQSIYARSLFQNGWSITNNGYNSPYIFVVPYYAYNCLPDNVKGPGTYRLDGKIHGDSTQVFSNKKGFNWNPDSYQWRHCDAQGNTLFLMNADFKASQPGSGVGGLHSFPGMDQVQTAQSLYSGVTIAEMTESSLQGFVNNGYQNGPPASSAQSFNPLNLDPSNLNVPGYFGFPVCFSGDDTAAQVYSGYGKNTHDIPYWPCGADGGSAKTEFPSVYAQRTLGFAPGTCKAWIRVTQSSDTQRSIQWRLTDNFGTASLMPGADGDGFQTIVYNVASDQDPVQGEVPTIFSTPFTFSMDINPEDLPSTNHDPTTFSYDGNTWTDTSPNCDKQGYNYSKKYWDNLCTFPCYATQ